MKKAIGGAGTLIVLILGYVAAGPFMTIRHIKVALIEQDSEALSEGIDFLALRQNLKEQLNALVMKQTTTQMGDNPFGGLALLFASKLVDGVVDSVVTPSGLMGLARGEEPSLAQTASAGPNPSVQSTATETEPFRGARYHYDSPSKFSAWVPRGEGEDIRFVFTRYGLKWKLSNIVLPPIPAAKAAAASSSPNTGGCLKIDTFDSSILSTNEVFTELAWKVDVANSCSEPLSTRVTFTIYDKDEFKLDSDTEGILVPGNGIGKARGKMLVSPPEKAQRMRKQGASLSVT